MMKTQKPQWKVYDNLEEETLSKKEIESLGLSVAQLKELCFSLFLAYYGWSRMRNYQNRIEEEITKQAKNYSSNKKIDSENLLKLKLNEEIYTFVGNKNSSYFIGKTNPKEDDVIKSFLTEKSFPTNIRGEPANKKFCVAKNYFQYNVARALQNSQTNLSDFIKKIDFPECNESGCNDCLNSLNNLSFDNLDESEVGHLFSGKSIKVGLPMDFLRMFLENSSEWYSTNKEIEKAYCTILAYLLSQRKNNIEYVTNDELKSPNYSEEVDTLFINKKDGILIEISMSNKLSPKYIQDKIHNAYLIKEQLQLDKLKTIIVAMNRDIEVKRQLMEAKKQIKDHILNFKDRFSIMGYDDRFSSLVEEDYFEEGFFSLREIFNDFYEKLINEISNL